MTQKTVTAEASVAASHGSPRVCVYAGSRPGSRDAYVRGARALGAAIAARNLTLVYGGGGTGLMGAVADAALLAGAKIIGIMPSFLVDREVAHKSLTELRVTRDMHERKKMMVDLADAFVALPGGFGTFDELFEVSTWSQIGLHKKPIGLLNTEEYFEPFSALAMHIAREGFAAETNASLWVKTDDPGALLDALFGTHESQTSQEGNAT